MAERHESSSGQFQRMLSLPCCLAGDEGGERVQIPHPASPWEERQQGTGTIRGKSSGFAARWILTLQAKFWASFIAQLVQNLPAMQEPPVRFLGQEDSLDRDRLPTTVFLSFPCGSAGKKTTCNAGDLGSIPGLGRSPGEGKSYPLQYSGLENSMDCIVYGITKSRTQLSDFHFHFQGKF